MAKARQLEDLFPRAPRYVIEIGDRQVVRFAPMPKGSKPMHTRIVNLSESGMAFLVPTNSAPEAEEQIKVEFTAPNSEPVACFARVVRVEMHRAFVEGERPQTFALVGVEFMNLHPRQREQIANGLDKRFADKHRSYQWSQLWLKLQWQLKSLWLRLRNPNEKEPGQGLQKK
jgi:hypothetical protein